MALRPRPAAIALLVAMQVTMATRPAIADETAAKKPARVIVTTATGSSLQGTLLALGPESLSLLVRDQEAPVSVPLDDVARIQTARDPNRDGVTKGALTLGLLCMLACAEGTSSNAEYWGTVLGNAVMGAGIGWGLDALVVSRSTIYEKPGRQLTIGARYRW